MSWANDYVGIPWRWRGRSRRFGVDCYGVVRLVYAEKCRINLPEHQYLSTADALAHIEDERSAWIPVQTPEPFDVAIVETTTRHPISGKVKRDAHHLVICVDDETILEAREPVGVVTGPHPKRIVEWMRAKAWS